MKDDENLKVKEDEKIILELSNSDNKEEKENLIIKVIRKIS